MEGNSLASSPLLVLGRNPWYQLSGKQRMSWAQVLDLSRRMF